MHSQLLVIIINLLYIISCYKNNVSAVHSKMSLSKSQAEMQNDMWCTHCCWDVHFVAGM